MEKFQDKISATEETLHKLIRTNGSKNLNQAYRDEAQNFKNKVIKSRETSKENSIQR